MDMIRALRLPFISVSVLGFVFGSLIDSARFDPVSFLLGLIGVISVHLSSNLVNDYADSKSGVDWRDKRFFGYFGGSKLIQEGLISEKKYLFMAVGFVVLSFISVTILSLLKHDFLPILACFIIFILGWSYSHRPLKFSYRMWGELVIFILFGPAVVMGAYYIQTGIFPSIKSFILSLPFGFFTSAILLANQIPDFAEDSLSGKRNLLVLTGPKRAYVIYFILVFLGYLSIDVAVSMRYINILSLSVNLLIILGLRAGKLQRLFYGQKEKLVESSKLTILMYNLTGIILILGVLW
jgi:1,4-dihydroxy-2-naphthoate polyprenyltransferase